MPVSRKIARSWGAGVISVYGVFLFHALAASLAVRFVVVGRDEQERLLVNDLTGDRVTERIVGNAPFWTDVFCGRYVRVIESFRAAAIERVEPAFANIEADAKEAEAAEYARLMALPADGEYDPDPGDLAERATEFGIDYLELMSDMQQGVRNGLVVGLHHLFEQLQLDLVQQLSSRVSERPMDLSNLLLTCGISTCGFSSSGKLDELRLTANTIKHGRGPAQRELTALRPDLFVSPYGRRREVTAIRVDLEHVVLEPFAGEGLYVTVEDLLEWVDAVIAYWRELSDTLTERWRRYKLGEPLIDPPF